MNPEDHNIEIAGLGDTLHQLPDPVAQVITKNRDPLTAAGTELSVLRIKRIDFRSVSRLREKCLRFADTRKRVMSCQEPGLAETGQTGHGQRMGGVFEPGHRLGPARLHFFVSRTLAFFYVFAEDAKHFGWPRLLGGKNKRSGANHAARE